MAAISTKGLYAVAAVYVLFSHKEETPLPIKQIALEAGIPKNFLEQILNQLKKAGILKSTRGATGGYVLARDPSEITFLEVMAATEGKVCEANPRSDNQVIELFWQDFTKQVEAFLSQPLSEFADYEERVESEVMFYI